LIPERSKFSELGVLANAFERLTEESPWTAELRRWCMMVTTQVMLLMKPQLPYLKGEPEVSIPTDGSK
jgi:hypothetical protein